MKNKGFCAIVLCSFLLALTAHAEYRVYQYLVKSKNSTSLVGRSPASLHRSTLNPMAYLAYHGGTTAIDITLMNSWMCPGHTAKKEYCPSPSERASDE